jgi:hypothetical protein
MAKRMKKARHVGGAAGLDAAEGWPSSREHAEQYRVPGWFNAAQCEHLFILRRYCN